MNKIVLDASALLTLLNGEPGFEVIAGRLEIAEISSVTLAEAVSVLADMKIPGEDITRIIDRLGIVVHPFARNAAFTAALIKTGGDGPALNLSDRACLALAMQIGAPVITMNPMWSKVNAGVPIKIVNRKTNSQD